MKCEFKLAPSQIAPQCVHKSINCFAILSLFLIVPVLNRWISCPHCQEAREVYSFCPTAPSSTKQNVVLSFFLSAIYNLQLPRGQEKCTVLPDSAQQCNEVECGSSSFQLQSTYICSRLANQLCQELRSVQFLLQCFYLVDPAQSQVHDLRVLDQVVQQRAVLYKKDYLN